MKSLLTISRAPQFSPNSVEKDRAIIEAVADRLRSSGCEVDLMAETAVIELPPEVMNGYTRILSMGRLPQTLDLLSAHHEKTINTAASVRICSNRKTLRQLMASIPSPLLPPPSTLLPPPYNGSTSCWLKRTEGWASHPDDVCFCRDKEALASAIQQFAKRGVDDYVVSTHVEGDLVKFYGIRGTDFFRCYYPNDDGQSKFGLERHNGPSHHYPFPMPAFRNDIDRLATAIGIHVYGGDAIIRRDGTYCIIDFNDWPSFSRCCDEAAKAIADIV